MSLIHRLGNWFTRKPSQPIRRLYRRPAAEVLEARLAPATFIEAEVNDTFAAANVVNIATGDILTQNVNDWLIISGSIDPATDKDFYQFTIGADSGVFFDIDARDTNISGVDTVIDVFDSAMVAVTGGTNDDGFDFQGFAVPPGATPATASKDSSLYLDLIAGTYYVRVSSSGAATTGGYELRLLADDSYTTSVPTFNSLPTAADTLYLDFTGHASATDAWTTRDIAPGAPVVPNGPYVADPFDFNNNDTVFSPGERLAIQNIWRIVAEDFSPFRMNISTSPAIVAVNGVGFQMVITNSDDTIIGGSVTTLGVAFVNSYAVGADDNIAFTFADSHTDYGSDISGTIVARALQQGFTVSHEFGHALGLEHLTTSVAPNPIMNDSGLGLVRGRWSVGINELNQLQDDMAIISNSTNTFGYRADDYGNSIATASLATATIGGYQNNGVIAQVTDRDVFRFTGGGPTTIKVDVDEYSNNLDVQVRLFNPAGIQIGISNDPGKFDGDIFIPNLASGTYYVQVRSSTAPGDAGQYRLTIDTAVTSVEVVNGNVLIKDVSVNGKDDTLEISRNGSNVRIFDPNFHLTAGFGAAQVDPFTVDIPFINFTGKIVVKTVAGNDQLTLDFSTGNPIPAAGLAYNGGAGTNRLIAADLDNHWTINGPNSGKIDSLNASFVNVQILIGGTLRDIFYFATTDANISGFIDGAPGSNWLNYASVTSGVVANLKTGVVTRVAQPVRNIDNVIGSALGGDKLTGSNDGGVLVGHGTGNVITAGKGFTVIIGGAGVNSLLGGAGSDLLINGHTKYDNDVVQLEKVFAIWATNDPYLTRIDNLNGPAGTPRLVVGETVFLHAGVTVAGTGIRMGQGNFVYLSTIYGSGDDDWFLTKSSKTLFDRTATETVTST